jgi:hypothetical protein
MLETKRHGRRPRDWEPTVGRVHVLESQQELIHEEAAVKMAQVSGWSSVS